MKVNQSLTMTRGDFDLWTHVCVSNGSGDSDCYVVMKRKVQHVWELWRSPASDQPLGENWIGAWDTTGECYDALFRLMYEDLA